MRWCSAGRAWVVYVGRYAARELSEHDHDHRSAGAVYRTAWFDQGPRALRRGEGEGPRGQAADRAADLSFAAGSGVEEAAMDWKLFGSAAGAGFCELRA